MKQLITAIEEAAYECGTLDLNVLKYAHENGYGHTDKTTGDWTITREELQEIADVFCDIDIINY